MRLKRKASSSRIDFTASIFSPCFLLFYQRRHLMMSKAVFGTAKCRLWQCEIRHLVKPLIINGLRNSLGWRTKQPSERPVRAVQTSGLGRPNDQFGRLLLRCCTAYALLLFRVWPEKLAPYVLYNDKKCVSLHRKTTSLINDESKSGDIRRAENAVLCA